MKGRCFHDLRTSQPPLPLSCHCLSACPVGAHPANKYVATYSEIDEMTTEKPCNPHPDAPHGFVRNASHSVGHYVCECSVWTPPDPKSLQERLRDGADICHARKIYTDFAGIAEEAADRIDLLEELNAQLREQNNAVDAACAYLERQIDALEAEVESLQLRNQELAADKEVLLGNMATIRNVTNDPAIASLADVVLERMAPGGMK